MNDDSDAVDAPLAGPLSRRNFLAVAGVGGATVAAVVATGGIPGVGAAVASRTAAASGSGSSSGENTDVATAQFAASLEVVAARAYQATLDAAGAGKLGAVPPAGAEFVTTALSQHRAQLERWNDILTAVGQPAVIAPDPKLPTLTNKSFRQLAGSIQIIDAQHVAILNYVLGEYPVPDVFAKTDLAAAP